MNSRQKTIEKNQIKYSDIEEMKNIPLNSSRKISDNLSIMRVPGGWIYINAISGLIVTSCFVPEPLLMERKLSQNVLDNKPYESKQLSTNPCKEIPLENEKLYYIIHWEDQNNKERNKFQMFNDEKHFNNWYDKWTKMGNKIIGVYTCDSLGNLIDQENKNPIQNEN